MSLTQTETSHTEYADMSRHNFVEIPPASTQARSPSLKSAVTGTASSGQVIGGDRHHFVKTVLKNGESDLSCALAHIFQTVVSQAIESGGTREIQDLYQRKLFYGRKSAAVTIAPPNDNGTDDTMKIAGTDDGDVLIGSSRIPGGLETPDLVLVILPRLRDTVEPARLVLLEAGTPGISFRSESMKTGGQTIIADSISLKPSMILGRTSGGSDFSDRILFDWGAFGSAAMLMLLAAQAIRLVSWSYREKPGDWLSSHTSGYTFGDVILDQEASLAYLSQSAESADAFGESAHMHGYKALRYAYRATTRIVYRTKALLDMANPHLAIYLEDKRMEYNSLIGCQVNTVPSFTCLYRPTGFWISQSTHQPPMAEKHTERKKEGKSMCCNKHNAFKDAMAEIMKDDSFRKNMTKMMSEGGCHGMMSRMMKHGCCGHAKAGETSPETGMPQGEET